MENNKNHCRWSKFNCRNKWKSLSPEKIILGIQSQQWMLSGIYIDMPMNVSFWRANTIIPIINHYNNRPGSTLFSDSWEVYKILLIPIQP